MVNANVGPYFVPPASNRQNKEKESEIKHVIVIFSMQYFWRCCVFFSYLVSVTVGHYQWREQSDTVECWVYNTEVNRSKTILC